MAYSTGTSAGPKIVYAADAGISTTFTFDGWFKYLGSGAGGGWQFVGLNSAGYCGLAINPGGTALLFIWNGGSNNGADLAVDTTDWHHWAVTRSGTTYFVYKDGAQVDTGTCAGTPDGQLQTGAGGSVASCAGANLRWWNFVATQAQVQQMMWRFLPPFSGCVAWWPCWTWGNQPDLSGNGHPGTLSGSGTTVQGPAVGWGAPVLLVGSGVAGGPLYIPGYYM